VSSVSFAIHDIWTGNGGVGSSVGISNKVPSGSELLSWSEATAH
jgi:hypothetical protein